VGDLYLAIFWLYFFGNLAIFAPKNLATLQTSQDQQPWSLKFGKVLLVLIGIIAQII